MLLATFPPHGLSKWHRASPRSSFGKQGVFFDGPIVIMKRRVSSRLISTVTGIVDGRYFQSFLNCRGVASLGADSLVVADAGCSLVAMLDGLGKVIAVNKDVRLPWDVASHNGTQVMVTDAERGSIVCLHTNSDKLWECECRSVTNVGSLAVADDLGLIAVADSWKGQVVMHKSTTFESGRTINFKEACRHSGQDLTSCNVEYIAMDSTGQLYVSSGASGIHIFNPTGTYLRTIRTFPHPTGLCVTPSGNLLVADRDDRTVSLCDRDGHLLQRLVSVSSRLGHPHGIALTSNNRLVVCSADELYSLPNKLQIFQLS